MLCRGAARRVGAGNPEALPTPAGAFSACPCVSSINVFVLQGIPYPFNQGSDYLVWRDLVSSGQLAAIVRDTPALQVGAGGRVGVEEGGQPTPLQPKPMPHLAGSSGVQDPCRVSRRSPTSMLTALVFCVHASQWVGASAFNPHPRSLNLHRRGWVGNERVYLVLLLSISVLCSGWPTQTPCVLPWCCLSRSSLSSTVRACAAVKAKVTWKGRGRHAPAVLALRVPNPGGHVPIRLALPSPPRHPAGIAFHTNTSEAVVDAWSSAILRLQVGVRPSPCVCPLLCRA